MVSIKTLTSKQLLENNNNTKNKTSINRAQFQYFPVFYMKISFKNYLVYYYDTYISQ